MSEQQKEEKSKLISLKYYEELGRKLKKNAEVFDRSGILLGNFISYDRETESYKISTADGNWEMTRNSLSVRE